MHKITQNDDDDDANDDDGDERMSMVIVSYDDDDVKQYQKADMATQCFIAISAKYHSAQIMCNLLFHVNQRLDV